ncbi:DUF2214 family protein [Brevundimonas sp.]|uniref:DUF2214 family protein n=1 Tax=Brevundimonas sp. TaxID=1871086 RepID=UPI002619FEBA|nr:DUF2214 family protein [Brevundimonas sp.]
MSGVELDTGLAIAHHILVFGLAIMLAMELAYLRGDSPPLVRLAGLDAGYGMTSLLIIAIGVCRVLWGAKGWTAYEANPFFWAKVGTFAVMGLSSIAPTLAFLNWRKASRADPAFTPQSAEVARVARWVRIELFLLFPLVGFAAAMARH